MSPPGSRSACLLLFTFCCTAHRWSQSRGRRAQTEGGSRKGGHEGTKGRGDAGAAGREGQGTILGAKNLSVAMVSTLC